MTSRPLPLFRFTEFALPSTPPAAPRPGAMATRRLRRLLAAASANEMPEAADRALVLDLHAHLRRVARAD